MTRRYLMSASAAAMWLLLCCTIFISSATTTTASSTNQQQPPQLSQVILDAIQQMNDVSPLLAHLKSDTSFDIPAAAAATVDATSHVSSLSPASRRLHQSSSSSDSNTTIRAPIGDPTSKTDPAYAFEFQGLPTTGTTPPVQSFDISQFIPVGSLPYMPYQGGYVIDDNIPWLDYTQLEYTERDWSRWDSFDYSTDLMFTPTRFDTQNNDGNNLGSFVWGLGNGQIPTPGVESLTPGTGGIPSNADGSNITGSTYLNMFQSHLISNAWLTGYSWFRYFSYGSYDIIKQLTDQNQFSVTDLVQNVSYALNENYNVYRGLKKQELRNKTIASLLASGHTQATLASVNIDDQVNAAFDALPIDWKGIKRNNYTFTWLEMYLNKVLDIGTITHSIVPRDDGNGPYDSFGLMQNAISYGVGYSQFVHFFTASSYGYLFAHYLRHLSTPLIRRIRTYTYASLSAQYAIFLLNGAGTVADHSTCQWLLRVTGVTTHAYVILQSEKYLKERGVWNDAQDKMTVLNKTNGQWPNEDILEWATFVTDKLVNRTIQYGWTEFLSTYYGQSMDILSSSIPIAPTQHIYFQLEKMWKIFYYDLSLHFFPGASVFSGPSGRSYDLFDGAHMKSDQYDLPQYIGHLFLPSCWRPESTLKWDGTQTTEILNSCTKLSPQLGKPSGDPGFMINRVLFSAAQSSGIGYLPMDILYNIVIKSPYRTVQQLFSEVKGQERFNFISPNYQIGHSGEDGYGIPLSNYVCARLAGEPTPGSYKAIVTAGETFSLSYIRLFSELNDTPFFKQDNGVAGDNLASMARLVMAQHQSYLLITSWFSGRHFFRDAEIQSSWNTNIVLPIGANAIYANNVKMPMTINSTVAVPLNSIITVRHLNASCVLRILRADRSPLAGISDAPNIFSINDPNRYQPGMGQQQFALTWSIDAQSAAAGVGRMVIHHKHKSNTTDLVMRSYRVSQIWACGVTRNDREMYALQRLVKYAKLTESITPLKGWNESDQPWYGTPAGRPSWSSDPAGECIWKTGVTIGNTTLQVDRHEVYQPWSWDAAFSVPLVSPRDQPPFYLKDFNRTANGQDIFSKFFISANNTNYPIYDTPFNYMSHKPEEILQHHLTSPITCTPGVDFPCWQWIAAAWEPCTAACGKGSQHRVLTCVDRSAGNVTATDNDLCGPNTLWEFTSCYLGPCPSVPDSPTITNVVVTGSQQALVTFTPPAFNGLHNITGYEIRTIPESQITKGTKSPLLATGLLNGQTYVFTIMASNILGASNPSTPSTAIVPDEYTWTYTATATCSQPCGGGTLTRTVACVGSVVGVIGNTKDAELLCRSPTPTDLTIACNTQSCVYSATEWTLCSVPCFTGVRTRDVFCSDGLGAGMNAGYLTVVPMEKCASLPADSKPITSQACNTEMCPIDAPIAAAVNSSSVKLSWVSRAANLSYVLGMSNVSAAGPYVTAFNGIGDEALITGLRPMTQYYFQLRLDFEDAVWTTPPVRVTTDEEIPLANDMVQWRQVNWTKKEYEEMSPNGIPISMTLAVPAVGSDGTDLSTIITPLTSFVLTLSITSPLDGAAFYMPTPPVVVIPPVADQMNLTADPQADAPSVNGTIVSGNTDGDNNTTTTTTTTTTVTLTNTTTIIPPSKVYPTHTFTGSLIQLQSFLSLIRIILSTSDYLGPVSVDVLLTLDDNPTAVSFNDTTTTTPSTQNENAGRLIAKGSFTSYVVLTHDDESSETPGGDDIASNTLSSSDSFSMSPGGTGFFVVFFLCLFICIAFGAGVFVVMRRRERKLHDLRMAQKATVEEDSSTIFGAAVTGTETPAPFAADGVALKPITPLASPTFGARSPQPSPPPLPSTKKDVPDRRHGKSPPPINTSNMSRPLPPLPSVAQPTQSAGGPIPPRRSTRDGFAIHVPTYGGTMSGHSALPSPSIGTEDHYDMSMLPSPSVMMSPSPQPPHHSALASPSFGPDAPHTALASPSYGPSVSGIQPPSAFGLGTARGGSMFHTLTGSPYMLSNIADGSPSPLPPPPPQRQAGQESPVSTMVLGDVSYEPPSPLDGASPPPPPMPRERGVSGSGIVVSGSPICGSPAVYTNTPLGESDALPPTTTYTYQTLSARKNSGGDAPSSATEVHSPVQRKYSGASSGSPYISASASPPPPVSFSSSVRTSPPVIVGVPTSANIVALPASSISSAVPLNIQAQRRSSMASIGESASSTASSAGSSASAGAAVSSVSGSSGGDGGGGGGLKSRIAMFNQNGGTSSIVLPQRRDSTQFANVESFGGGGGGSDNSFYGNDTLSPDPPAVNTSVTTTSTATPSVLPARRAPPPPPTSARSPPPLPHQQKK